jgi:hypothetical protein
MKSYKTLSTISKSKNEDKRYRRSETSKSFFDFNKHLSILSSGSILVVLSLGEKFTSGHQFTAGMFYAITAFVFSIIGAFLVLGVLSFCTDGSILKINDSVFLLFGFLLSAGGFIGGMSLLASQASLLVR